MIAAMNVNLRELKPEEYSRQPEPVVNWPEGSYVVGAFTEEDKLVGRIAVVELPHIEGTWVDPEYRNGLLPAKMVRAVENGMKAIGRSHVFAFAPNDIPEIADYLQRFGYEAFPVTVWVKKLEE